MLPLQFLETPHATAYQKCVNDGYFHHRRDVRPFHEVYNNANYARRGVKTRNMEGGDGPFNISFPTVLSE
jgi:hypothetical protein